jgi:hypothetical protein
VLYNYSRLTRIQRGKGSCFVLKTPPVYRKTRAWNSTESLRAISPPAKRVERRTARSAHTLIRLDRGLKSSPLSPYITPSSQKDCCSRESTSHSISASLRLHQCSSRLTANCAFTSAVADVGTWTFIGSSIDFRVQVALTILFVYLRDHKHII